MITQGMEGHSMKKSRCTAEQIAFALRQAGGRAQVLKACRKMGIAEHTFDH